MSDSPTPVQRPITDSPWFWALLFSAAGLVCVLVIMPQYEQRQRRLEMQSSLARRSSVVRRKANQPHARRDRKVRPLRQSWAN